MSTLQNTSTREGVTGKLSPISTIRLGTDTFTVIYDGVSGSVSVSTTLTEESPDPPITSLST